MKQILFCGIFLLLFAGCKEEDPLPMLKYSTLTDSRDNRTYRYLNIGDQTWMMDNVAYLPEVFRSSNGSVTEPRYYVYDYEGSEKAAAAIKTNFITYGVLYNYEAAKTACPSGWHLPTDKEWKLLSITLGMEKWDADSIGFSSSKTVGAAMKSTMGWQLNGNGTNSSGFTAVPGGFRSHWGGFGMIGQMAYFWSATENTAESAWFRDLVCDFGSLYRYFSGKSEGMSVRCLKD